jgi:hypothetical protein
MLLSRFLLINIKILVIFFYLKMGGMEESRFVNRHLSIIPLITISSENGIIE